MLVKIISRILLVALLLLPAATFAQTNAEEFNGPFGSWANVKTRFGAKGDGKTDDTRALQRALDNLTVSIKSFNTGTDGYVVLYLPAGKYVISNTLVLRGKIGVTIIGEDPASTALHWHGNDNDTMFWANGSAQFKIGRLSWEAGGRKNVEAIGLHWKNKWNNKESQSFASLNIEISDCNFLPGLARGISGGTAMGEDGTGNNDSEVTIRRCYFYNNTEYAIKIRGYNALDYWIWDCRFYNCNTAIYNESGNYHIYRSYFARSKQYDIYNRNGYYTSVRGCFSYRSNAFSGDEGASCNPFKRVFQDNIVINTKTVSVRFYHLGKLTFLDNTFTKNIDTGDNANVDYRSWCPGDYQVLSVNNQFEYKQPVSMQVPRKRMYSYRDNVGKSAIRADTVAFFKTMQKRPVKKSRQVFEVPAGADTEQIQDIINNAARQKGKKVIVHFPPVIIRISGTVTIPANSDMQLVGDGIIYSSNIAARNNFPAGRPLLHVKGPSFVTIRDIQFGQHSSDKDRFDLVLFSNVDQPQSMAIADQVYSAATNSINLEGLCNLYVQNENSFFSFGNRVIGCSNCGSGCTSRLAAFGGQFAGVKVENNGRFVAKDCWWEGDRKVVQNISGKGSITIDGAMIAPIPADTTTSVRIGDFEGKVSLMNMYIQGALDIDNASNKLAFLGWNIHFYHKMQPLAFLRSPTFSGLFRGITSQCFDARKACKDILSIGDESVNVRDEESFILDMFSEDRAAKPLAVVTAKQGSSAIFISRVSFGNCNKGLVFTK
jgi:hypothetical protein